MVSMKIRNRPVDTGALISAIHAYDSNYSPYAALALVGSKGRKNNLGGVDEVASLAALRDLSKIADSGITPAQLKRFAAVAKLIAALEELGAYERPKK